MRRAGLLLATGQLGHVPLARAARRGDLLRLRRGAYVGAGHWEELDPAARHVLVVRAAITAQPDALVSHWSAAAMLGLPLVGRRDEAVHVTVPAAGGGRSGERVRRHQAAGSVAERMVDGIRVTSPARTLVDLACSAGLLAAVAAGDAALRTGLVTGEELRDEIAARGSRRGVRVARRAVDLMDGRAESPGESLSRVRMAELGIPLPDLQHEVRDREGFVGRVDFWWEQFGVVGEFDGRVKYGLDAPASAGDDLWNEKLREDRIRATGPTMARWTWRDAWLGTPMADRLRAAGVRWPSVTPSAALTRPVRPIRR